MGRERIDSGASRGPPSQVCGRASGAVTRLRGPLIHSSIVSALVVVVLHPDGAWREPEDFAPAFAADPTELTAAREAGMIPGGISHPHIRRTQIAPCHSLVAGRARAGLVRAQSLR